MGSCNACFVFPNLIPARCPSRLGATNQGFDLDFRISSWSRIMFDNMFRCQMHFVVLASLDLVR